MFRVKLAESPAELDGAYRLRHRVLVDEERYVAARPDGRIRDRFDDTAGVGNIIAVHEGRIVGNVRFMADREGGSAPDEYLDFAPLLPPAARGAGAHVGGGSWLSIERSARRVPRLSLAMMAMGYRWCIEQGLTHVKVAANPDVLPMLEGTGFHPIGKTFYDEKHGLPVVPLLLDLAHLGAPFASLIGRQRGPHAVSGFDRQFHSAGEPVHCPADEVMLVIAGEITRFGADGATHLGPGAFLSATTAAGGLTAASDLDLLPIGRAALATQRPDLLSLLSGL